MLPFLKHRDDGVGVGPIPTIERKPDTDDPGFDMLGAVADDLLKAIEKKDKGLLKDALEALCMHIQDMDAEQDTRMTGE